MLHSSRNQRNKPKEQVCTWKNCHSSFSYPAELVIHMNIHTNNLYKCTFCPYRAAHPHKLIFHYRSHYKIFDYKCEICGKAFTANDTLLHHIRRKHDVEMASCPLCKMVGKKESIYGHLAYKHNVYSKWNKATNSFDVFQR